MSSSTLTTRLSLLSILLNLQLGLTNFIEQRRIYRSGFVGCLFENVCLENEACFDDNYFGQCVDLAATTVKVSNNEGRTTSWVIDFARQKLNSGNKINWLDMHVQCVIRTAIQDPSLSDHELGFLCGVITAEPHAVDRFNDVTFESDVLEFLPENQFLPKDYRYNGSEEYGERRNANRPKRVSTGLYGWSADPVEKLELVLLNRQFDKEIKRLVQRIHRMEKSANRPDRSDELMGIESIEANSLQPERFNILDEMLAKTQFEGGLPKRRYQLSLPFDTKPLVPPVRSWVWVQFVGISLDALQAEAFLRELSNRLQLTSPIEDYFLDRTGTILYFRVPKVTGLNVESVVSALKQGKGNFDQYQIDHVGYGRGQTVMSTANTQRNVASGSLLRTTADQTVTEPAASRSLSFKLIIGFSILGLFVLLGLIYGTAFCYRRARLSPSKQWQHHAQLIDIELGNKKNSRRKSGWFGKLRNTFHEKLGLRQKKTREVEHKQTSAQGDVPFTENAKAPLIENTTTCGVNRGISFPQGFSPKEGRKPPKMEQNDSVTSQRSSTSSWSSEPVSGSIDLTTGHLILSYMETYLNDENRLTTDWKLANAYEAEEATPCSDAQKPENLMKNRASAPMPYEQSRVRLRNIQNDYINASLLFDHSPRNPSYIATPTPMVDTLSDFWEMIWEQTSVVIVCLERSDELKRPPEVANELSVHDDSVQYWPNEGSTVYGKFEVHLVSEHSWCEEFVIRSFYLKNLETSETRTVTQFHYLKWYDENLKNLLKPVLEFRRKVNRSFRGMMSPIVVHCLDGSGRSGTYILMDLVLNRISKGVKEINIAATLEHLRDQRQGMVHSKEQYEFVFTAVAQEVDTVLKTTGQST